MKKLACLMLVVLVTLCCAVLAGCAEGKMDAAIKNGDNYTIAAAYDDETHILSAVQTVELTNRSENSFDAIKFHIYANQYRQDAAHPVVPNVYRTRAYPNGESYGDIAFDSVLVAGKPVAFTVEGEDCDILSVPTAGLEPNKSVEVELTYQVQLANVHHRLGYNDNTVNLGNWYPVLCHIDNGSYTASPYYNIGDPFVSEVANYKVSLTLPEKYVVASTGELTDALSSGGNVTYTYAANAVRDFAMVLSDKFTKISRTVGDTQVNYFYYADADAETSLQTACGMVEMLNEKVGRYPYAQYSVAETEFCYGGMEYPNLALVTSRSESYQDAVAHETAHQWFYGLVGNDQIAAAWQDEGLSEFVTYLYLDKVGTVPLATNILQNIRTYTTYVDVLDKYYSQVDCSLRPIYGYKNDGEYVVFTYVKGSLLFSTLYETVGAAKFWKALSCYFDEAIFTVAPYSQLENCFAKVCGDEAANIFEQFVEGNEIIGKVTD